MAEAFVKHISAVSFGTFGTLEYKKMLAKVIKTGNTKNCCSQAAKMTYNYQNHYKSPAKAAFAGDPHSDLIIVSVSSVSQGFPSVTNQTQPGQGQLDEETALLLGLNAHRSLQLHATHE